MEYSIIYMIPLNAYQTSSWVWGSCIWIIEMYTNWKLRKKKKKDQSTALIFFVQIYHEGEENFF